MRTELTEPSGPGEDFAKRLEGKALALDSELPTPWVLQDQNLILNPQQPHDRRAQKEQGLCFAA